MSEKEQTVEQWWIATNLLDKGGKKVMGPFATHELAIEVRTLRENAEGHAAYFVDKERVPK